MSPITGGILIWVLFGVWAYGRNLAYWQNEYPTIRELGDVGMAIFVGAFGPIGLITTITFGGHGLQFWPKPPEQSMFSTRMGFHDRKKCPHCENTSHVTEEEKRNDDWLCTCCKRHFRVTTDDPVAVDLEDDEPDWSEPTESDHAWARATMPGKATGHMLAWRMWNLHMTWSGGKIDQTRLANLVHLTETELLDKFAELHREVAEARNKPKWLLASGNGYVWQPHEPMVGYRVEDMPRAHGAGIYATKESPNGGDVYGQVALWGSVVEHKAGYRARYAYPVKLWARTEEIAESLRKAYNVPCEVDEKLSRHSEINRVALQMMQQQMNNLQVQQHARNLQAQKQVTGGGLGGNPISAGLQWFPRI